METTSVVAEARTQTHLESAVASCRRSGARIEPVCVAPLDRTPRVFLNRPGDNPWTVTTIEDDPLTRQDRFTIPKDQIANLGRVRNSGVDFAELFIAHEHPPSVFADLTPGTQTLTDGDLTRLVNLARIPEPQRVVEHTNNTGLLIDLAARTTIHTANKAAAAVYRGAATAASSTIKTATKVGEALTRLDPIIIGAITPNPDPAEGDPVGLVVLARWDW